MRRQKVLLTLLAMPLLLLSGCRTVRTFDVPYPEVEARLIQRLRVAPEDLRRSSRIIAPEVDPTLARCLTVDSIGVNVEDYKAGQSLGLYLETRYDIGAVGGWRLKVNLRRAGDRRTRVAVNYVDKAVGFFLFPFAYVNPGWVREQKIARCVIEPPPTETACRSFQGKACGPENAEVPCVSADREDLRCVCQGTWRCRPPEHPER